MLPIDPNNLQKDMLETVSSKKVYTAFIIDSKVGIPFEYIANAINPRFWPEMKFYYYIGDDERVFKALNYKPGEAPRLAMVYYNRDTYGSSDYFSIHPVEDLARNGYRHFDMLLRTFNEVNYGLFSLLLPIETFSANLIILPLSSIRRP